MKRDNKLEAPEERYIVESEGRYVFLTQDGSANAVLQRQIKTKEGSRGSQYLLWAGVTSRIIRRRRDPEIYVQNEVDVVGKQLRGREGLIIYTLAVPTISLIALLFWCWATEAHEHGSALLPTWFHATFRSRMSWIQERRLRVRRSCLGITSHR